MRKIMALVLGTLLAFCCISAVAETTYPLDTDTTLSVWFVDIPYSSIYANEGEAPLFQAIEEMTGVDVDWIEPAAGADKETAYNLMMASTNLPDIIWSANITNNALTYLDDGVIIDLTPYVNAETMPNLTALYEANPSWEAAVKTDDGRMYGTIAVAEYECWQGPWVRTDWLEECGLAIPETIEDWEVMLKTFKEKYDATFVPMQDQGSLFLGAFGLPKFSQNSGFFQKDGTVKYVASDDGYKGYLELMAKWYADGLIDPDFASNDESIVVNKAANNVAGAVQGYQVSGAHILSAQGVYETTGDWLAIGYPKLADGERSIVEMGIDVVPAATAITTSCDDVDTAVKFLDWLYSDAGITLFNFGIEGVSFYYDEDGNPQYTDEFMNGPEGMVEYARRYTAIVGNCPNFKSFEAAVARNDQASNDAEAAWKGDWTNAEWAEIVLPILGATEDENDITTDIITALNTYVKENTYSFIIGEKSFDEWDAYLAGMDEIGLQKVLEIRQAQLDRVNNR